MDWTVMSAPRSRVLSDDGSWTSYPNKYWSEPAGVPGTFSTTGTYQSMRRYRRVFDVVTPGYKDLINKGQIINNDFLDVSLDSECSRLLFHVKAIWPGYPNPTFREDSRSLVSGDATGIVAVPASLESALALVSSDTGSLRSEAVTTAFSRVDVSELEMLASMGEMPETVEWFKDVLTRMLKILRDIKRREYMNALNRLKTRPGRTTKKAVKDSLTGAEDKYMEWRYAIRPLIFEVKSYLEALDSKLEHAVRKTARARKIDTLELDTYTNPTQTDLIAVQVHRTERSTRSIRAGVLYQLDPALTGWWTHLGLDAPTSALWAVTSLSFAIDWFFNVGQWIASWEPRLGLTPLTSWVVETRTLEIEGTGIPVPVAWGPYTSIERSYTDNGKYFCKLQVKARWANPDRQILPTFAYKGLDVARIADLTIIGRKLASGIFR